MPDYSGVTWRVNYGEIAEREQFRVGYVGMESYDAYFPVAHLSDLITTLNAVIGLGLEQVARGASVQAKKVSDGLITDVVIQPRLDTGTPVEIMRLRFNELTDFLYGLGLFQTALGGDLQPDDWNADRPGPLPEDSLPSRLSTKALNSSFVSLTAAAKNPDLLIVGGVTVDSSDLVTSASVVWPDGTPGTLTITARHSTGAVNAYNITYGSPVTRTYTQPTITRNSNGAATNVPQIVVS